MLIKLNHQSLDIYQAVRELIIEIYFITIRLPGEERFTMVQQMRRAALSVKLSRAEGESRRSPVERKRYIEVSGGNKSFVMLSKMM